MSAGTARRKSQIPQINWQDKYIDKLSNDVDYIKKDLGAIKNAVVEMEARLIERIDANNKQTQNLVLAMIIGIGAMTIATAIALALR